MAAVGNRQVLVLNQKGYLWSDKQNLPLRPIREVKSGRDHSMVTVEIRLPKGPERFADDDLESNSSEPSDSPRSDISSVDLRPPQVVPSLQRICEERICGMLSPRDVCDGLMMADLGCPHLAEYCYKYIALNIELMVSQHLRELRQLPVEALDQMLIFLYSKGVLDDLLEKPPEDISAAPLSSENSPELSAAVDPTQQIIRSEEDLL